MVLAAAAAATSLIVIICELLLHLVMYVLRTGCLIIIGIAKLVKASRNEKSRVKPVL